jgi:hypothetical protein
MSTTIPDEIMKEATKVSSLIATFQGLMADNKRVDLSNLEHKISALCKTAETTDLSQSNDVRNVLIASVEDLARLNDEVTVLYEKAGGSALEEDNTKRAMDAYGPDDKES